MGWRNSLCDNRLRPATSCVFSDLSAGLESQMMLPSIIFLSASDSKLCKCL